MDQNRRPWLDDYCRLSIYELNRGGFLDTRRFRLSLRFPDRSEKFFLVDVSDDELIFVEEGTIVATWNVKLQKTYPHYGGFRKWFICPDCGRRCAKLLILQDSLRCSHCAGDLPYMVENSGDFDAVMAVIARIRKRYGIQGFCGGKIERPYLMRRKKFQKIKRRLEHLESVADELYMRKAQQILKS